MPVISSLKSSSVAIKDVQLLTQNFSKPFSGFWWFGGHSENLYLVFAGFASVLRSRGTGATGATRDTEDTGPTGSTRSTEATGDIGDMRGHRGHKAGPQGPLATGDTEGPWTVWPHGKHMA